MKKLFITIVHTGRDISKERDSWICFSIGFILLATLLRAMGFYLGSAIIWSLPFIIFIWHILGGWLLLEWMGLRGDFLI